MNSKTQKMGGGGINTGARNTSGTLTEATGLPGEDRNGVERLTGETDDQYVLRQTRLRDEAKARMAAKFGGGGMSSAGPSSTQSTQSAPNSGGFSGPKGMSLKSGQGSAPSSGNFKSRTVTPQPPKIVAPAKALGSDDFFASFGT